MHNFWPVELWLLKLCYTSTGQKHRFIDFTFLSILCIQIFIFDDWLDKALSNTLLADSLGFNRINTFVW